jgi:hypothetical protein
VWFRGLQAEGQTVCTQTQAHGKRGLAKTVRMPSASGRLTLTLAKVCLLLACRGLTLTLAKARLPSASLPVPSLQQLAWAPGKFVERGMLGRLA